MLKRKRDFTAHDLSKLINSVMNGNFYQRMEHDVKKIRVNDSLYKHVDFSCVKMSDDDVEYISFILGVNTHVRTLDISCI